MRRLGILKGGRVLFLSVLLWSILIIGIVENLILIWVLLEVNILRFIPLIKRRGGYKVSSSMMKYFLIQSLGSFFILYRVIVSITRRMSFVIVIGLIIKLGNPPAFVWLPRVIKSIRWFSVVLLSTIQKLPPLIIFSMAVSSLRLVVIMCVIGFIVSGLGGLIQTHLISLMAYSSIAHIR